MYVETRISNEPGLRKAQNALATPRKTLATA